NPYFALQPLPDKRWSRKFLDLNPYDSPTSLYIIDGLQTICDRYIAFPIVMRYSSNNEQTSYEYLF
ncbi:hypothetical protein QUA25_25435, partial [Microcoleus sp. Pol17C6]|uniref:hypothetical protein n=1 Tax=Microcoleus sp. Pol17C6 TaxID=3055404 RepID=UPI002FD520C1